MIVAPDSQLAPSSSVTPPNRVKHAVLLWSSLALLALALVAVGVFVSNVPLSSETLRRRIVASLGERLDSDVELGDLSLRVYPTLRAEGSNLRIRRRGASPDLPPLIAIKSFHVDGSLFGIWRKHVDHVQLTGLDISIPPKAERIEQQKIRNGEPQPMATGGRDQSEPGATDRPENARER